MGEVGAGGGCAGAGEGGGSPRSEGTGRTDASGMPARTGRVGTSGGSARSGRAGTSGGPGHTRPSVGADLPGPSVGAAPSGSAVGLDPARRLVGLGSPRLSVGADPPCVAVLGASGFLGSAVAAMLARRHLRLRLVARRPSAVPADAVADVEVRAVDLTDTASLADAVGDVDAILHLVCHRSGARAWRTDDDPLGEWVNVGMVHALVDILRAAPEARRPACVFAGSASQAGLTARDRVDGTEEDHPASGYDRHKTLAERALLDATREGVLRAVSVRLPTVYGESRTPTAVDGGVVTAMARRALADEPLTVWRDGTIGRDLLHVDDAARALVTALDRVGELAGRHWVVGTGRTTTLGDLFRAVARLTADATGRPPVPVVTVEPPDHATPVDFHSFTVDATAFHRATGWTPRVPLQVGLSRTVAALARQGGAGEEDGAGCPSGADGTESPDGSDRAADRSG
ncbi:NAD-dependent epimerase/dehydratase family protein [Streptomyces flavofungini]|uniref:NAD-dependent epimerase/dehydratase family protein n=1 Tax=Streptomyces flavofungini TaxID=68200 RepID=UPI0025AFBB67|nr:NAD-dependent epimerase/dehydratase [Streptomyces flavofungini]WJV44440.1 NAD-dependent epimerase/dehydratase [Streptomyces flavofungini]